ncbi:MAG TPA: FAD-dependent oxidoreductase [bacterium]|jgi:NADPH-dependent 2,4-dienoyl-CoA reductase/sulfur reductase-like enzyme
MKHLIIGFGAAGANAAEYLRRNDGEAEITVLNGEATPFYLRLDLEGIFAGKPPEQLMPRPPEFWDEKRVTIIPHRAVKVDPLRQEVTTGSGQILSYDRLLIAAGTSPRKLAVPGRELPGVFHYHTLEDAKAIHAERERAKRVVIVGGGILGLEMAHAAVEFGWDITMLVRGGFVGSPMVDEKGGALVLEALRKAGVKVHFQDQVQSFEGQAGILRRVQTRQGHTLDVDLAALCVGTQPDTDFLLDSGLLTAGRLIVNEKLGASAPHVWAAGDAAVVRTTGGRLVSCHTWNVAQSQARTAAANMLGGEGTWRDDAVYNLDLLFDQPFAMIGAWDDRHEPGRIIHELSAPGAYRALVTREGILEGAFLLGNREGDRRVRKLIVGNARIEGKIDRVFAPDATPEEFAEK